MLVAIGVTSVLLLLLTKILIPGFRIWRHAQAVSELEQMSLVAQNKIKREFLATCQDSIATLDQPHLQAVSFLNHEGTLSAASYNPTEGLTDWRSMTVFKLERSTGVLSRIRWQQPPLPTSSAFALTTAQLTAACALPEAGLVASKMTSFQATPQTGLPGWLFRLEFSGTSPRGPLVIKNEFVLSPRVEASP